MKINRLSIVLLCALLLASVFLVTQAAEVGAADTTAPAKSYGKAAANKFLAAEHYAMTHFDPSQSDVIPYAAPRGTFTVDLTKAPRVPAGPINIITLASTHPNYMWGASTQGVTYIDISKGGFKEVARYADPEAKKLEHGTLDTVWAEKYTTLADVEKATKSKLGMDQTSIYSNIYILVDKDNVLFSVNYQTLRAYGLIDPKKPESGIKLLRSFDMSPLLRPEEAAFGVILSMTYDGKLLAAGPQSLRVLDRETFKVLGTVEFGKDEYVTNSMAIDEKNGIYIATDKIMRKLVWTGSKLSADAADGAWEAPYDYGTQEPPSVKFGKGTGSTPTLMGFGKDEDKLVVITDGADRMKIVAFWRDAIPAHAKAVEGAKSDRIAGELEITCGLNPLPEFIQSEQSVVVKGYGAFVVNNIRMKGAEDRLMDVFAGGPVLEPAVGAERVEWDVKKHAWKSVWTRNDIVSTSMVPAVSGPSNIVFANGYTKQDGWEVTGMDWETGKTATRIIFGQNNLGNGAYAIIQFMENGDLLFNSIGGPARVKLQK